MRDEIERFFGAYRDAFERADPVAIAGHVAAPAMLLGAETTLWVTDADVLAAMERLVAFYRAGGFASARFAVDRVLEQGGDHAVVDVIWTIDRTQGRLPWRFRTGYNLRRRDGAWRIVACTAYEEPASRRGAG